nr:hypothetical protein BaRGS_011911 [Batillaria attramentaria]
MSGRIHLKDQFGNDLYFGHAGDVWMPLFPHIPDFRQHLQDIRHLELRPDDIIIAGYPKSGFHWNHEIVHMLVHGAPEYVGTSGFGEFFDANLAASILPPVKPRIFFTHFKFHHLPQQMREKGVKLIYLTRNPKDLWVSLYNHVGREKKENRDWVALLYSDALPPDWYGDWFDYVLGWEKEIEANSDHPILVSNFEDLKKVAADSLKQVEKINEFLGLKRSKELCAKIAQACEFPSLKKAKDDQTTEEVRKMLWKDNAPGFYRKGELGDWKNWFTESQNDRFDAEYKKRMAGSKLTFTFA